MALVLEYQPRTFAPVELDAITPDRLQGRSLVEIERLTIPHGNQGVALADLFSVKGDPSDARIDFTGELRRVHGIGAGMTGGLIQIHGDAGRHVGSRMSGGVIHVDGGVGDGVGLEMSGGLIDVRGSAGDAVGSADAGSRLGMTDGTILIRGNAGAELGSKMRRGLIAVLGSSGADLGFGMIAGSILVFGDCGARPGAGMRRGTLGLFGASAPDLLPTFAHAGSFQPVFLPLIFAELARLGFDVDRGRLGATLALFRGDRVVDGKGEIWVKRP
jgi:formylmethanofuran dehydrogenase subunit C